MLYPCRSTREDEQEGATTATLTARFCCPQAGSGAERNRPVRQTLIQRLRVGQRSASRRAGKWERGRLETEDPRGKDLGRRGVASRPSLGRESEGVRAQYPQLRDSAWLRQRFTIEARPVRDIAAEIGCSRPTVYRALQAAGLRRDASSYRPSYPRFRDTQWLRQRYLVQGARMKDIAAEVGCRELAVRKALVTAKIPLRGVPPTYPQLRDRDWLRQQYAERHIDIPDIAAQVGCHPETARQALLAAGILRPGPARPRRRRFPALTDKDWLRRRYLGEQASLPELAGEIGYSIRAVRNALAEAQVPMRPQGQWKGRRAIDRATHRTHD